MVASLKAFIHRNSQENKGWLVSLGVHLLVLAVFALWLTPGLTRRAPFEIDSRFSGAQDSTKFEAAFELPEMDPDDSAGAHQSQMNPTELTAVLPRLTTFDEDALAAGPAAFVPGDGVLGEKMGEEGAGGTGSGFFGLSAAGKRFVYIVDASGSMEGRRFRRAKNELIRSLRRLRGGQQFFVIFYNFDAHVALGRGGDPLFTEMVPATRRNLKVMQKWISEIRPVGPTFPQTALKLALELKPDAIYFLSDGVFDPAILRRVKSENTSGITIHAIGFEDRVGEAVLRLLAAQNGGKYRFVR